MDILKIQDRIRVWKYHHLDPTKGYPIFSWFKKTIAPYIVVVLFLVPILYLAARDIVVMGLKVIIALVLIVTIFILGTRFVSNMYADIEYRKKCKSHKEDIVVYKRID